VLAPVHQRHLALILGLLLHHLVLTKALLVEYRMRVVSDVLDLVLLRLLELLEGSLINLVVLIVHVLHLRVLLETLLVGLERNLQGLILNTLVQVLAWLDKGLHRLGVL
jgi:hypothetical protein